MKRSRTTIALCAATVTVVALGSGTFTSFGADVDPLLVEGQKPLIEPEPFAGVRPERTIQDTDIRVGSRSAGALVRVQALAGGEWACSADMYEPDISWNPAYDPPRKGIWFDAKSHCTGAFGAQQLCVRLQEKDNQGDWYRRTEWLCNAWTVDPTEYTGRWASCRVAQEGRFRTGGRLTGDGPPPDMGYGHSTGAHLCNGF